MSRQGRTGGGVLGGRRGAFLAALTAGFVLVGVGVAVAARPESRIFEDLDGRTWITVEREAGPTALLLNGISGLIEAEAALDDRVERATFASSDGRRTLLVGDGSVTVLDDATHVGRTAVVNTPTAALLGGRVVVLDGRAGTLPVGLGGEVLALAAAPNPVPGAELLADGKGDVWFLGEKDGRRVAVSLDPTTLDLDEHPVAPTATALRVIDGAVYAVDARAVREVDGARSFPSENGAVVPEVALSTKGVWAFADDEVLTVFDGRGRRRERLGAAVEHLAIWNGRVAALADGELHLGGPERFERIANLDTSARFHVDGGVLWAVGTETAVAVLPGGDHTVIRVSNADLSLCVADCSPAAASTFLERRAAATSSARNKAPTPQRAGRVSPPRLEPPTVTPTLPSATVAPRARVTTTSVAPPPEEPTEEEPVHAEEAEPTQEAVPPLPPEGEREEEAPRERPEKPKNPADEAPTPPTPPPPAPPVELPVADDSDKGDKGDKGVTTTTEQASPTTTTTTTPGSTTTTVPPEEVGIGFEVDPEVGGAVARVRVQGTPNACGATGLATTATLAWTGSSSGSREMVITWNSPAAGQSQVSEATFSAEPGEITVEVSVCGRSASRTVTVPGETDATTTTTTTTTTEPGPDESTTTTTTPPATTTTTTTVPAQDTMTGREGDA